MRKSLIGAAGTAAVLAGVTATVAIGQTAPYDEPLPAPGKSAQTARDTIAKKLGTRAAGRALRAGRTVTVTITDAAPGSYSLTLTRGTSGTVSGTVSKVASKKVTIAKGKKTLGGTTTGTLKLKVKATKAGRKALRRTKAKRVAVKEAVTYKRSGSASRTSKRNLKLRLR